MLYYPGMLTQLLSSGLCMLVLSGFCYLGGKLFFQHLEIKDLKEKVMMLEKDIDTCQSSAIRLNNENGSLRDNLKLINEYNNKKPKPPALKDGNLLLENLFPNTLR